MKTFKNISNEDLSIIGVGIVNAGETVELPDTFHNANFAIVKGEDKIEKEKVEKDK